MNVLKVIGCSMALCALPLSGQTGGGTELFRDMKAPQHERIMDLLSRLTVEEKISLLVNDAVYLLPSRTRRADDGKNWNTEKSR